MKWSEKACLLEANALGWLLTKPALNKIELEDSTWKESVHNGS